MESQDQNVTNKRDTLIKAWEECQSHLSLTTEWKKARRKRLTRTLNIIKKATSKQTI